MHKAAGTTRALVRTGGVVALCSAAVLAAACSGSIDAQSAGAPGAAERSGSPGAGSIVTTLETPAGAGSTAYGLAAGADGRAYLVWIESVVNAGYALRFARFDGQAWSAARDIARGDQWFVNWADHASITALPDGSLLAHWLVNTGRKEGSYGYGIRVVRSTDEGRTWTTAFEDGMQNVSDYAGFLTFAPHAAGADAIYLTPLTPDDGTTAGHGEEERIKTLAAVSFGLDGSVSSQKVVDADVCSCCMTDITHTDRGPIAVYRDHLPGEIRDISIVRRVDGGWTAPAPVARDGWKIPGCPTNGPSAAARGSRVAVAWFTAAGDTPRLKLAFSDDAGATFGAPVVIDEGRPVGWPDVVLEADGSALVSWLERRAEGVGEVLVRRVRPGQAPGVPLKIAESVSGRATGVPHMVRAGDRLLVAWRKERVLTATVPASAVP